MIGSCAHCGSRVPADALKCPACGSVQIETAPSNAAPAVAVSGLTLLAVIAVAAVVLVAAPIGVMFFAGVLGANFFFATKQSEPEPAAVVSGAGGFDEVRAKGRFVVAADPAAPPFLSGSEGSYEGFEYALMAAIADAAGASLEIRPTPYDQLLDVVAAGAVDAAIGQLPPEPHDRVVYTRSYLQYNLCLTVKPESEVRSLSDLRGRTIGMYDDQTAEVLVNSALDHHWTEKTYGDYGYFRDLARGRIDAMVYDCPLTRYELQKEGAKLAIVDARLGVATYSIAVSADRAPLRTDIDRVLGELGGNGLLQQLSARWLGETPAEDAPVARIAVVRGGETLDGVAARALGDSSRAAELLEWNRDILGSDPRAVYAGMQLRLR